MSNKAFCTSLAEALLAVTLLLATVGARAEQPLWRDQWPQLMAVGSGETRFLGLRIYNATLWRAGPVQALQLRYARRISRERLVDTSVEEMQRVGVPRAQAEAWAPDMRRVFIDVEAGDELVGVFVPGEPTRFYSRSKLTGTIDDSAFGPAFLAIWLDPRTRDPALRASLLGERR